MSITQGIIPGVPKEQSQDPWIDINNNKYNYSMYADRQNQSQRNIYSWWLESIYCDVVQGQSCWAWSYNLFVCQMASWAFHIMTKQKRTWIKLDNVSMEKYGFGMDPKTKNKALRKLDRENLIQLHLLENSGKAPQVRLLTK